MGKVRRPGNSALAVACLFLAACGGGGGSGLPEPASLALVNDQAAVVWNSPATIDAAANDRASAGALSLVSVSAPAHGTATVVGGKIVYTPHAGYYGGDSLTYTASAGQGGATASARVDLSVEAQIVLSGTASDAPLPGAAIGVDVAGRTFTTTADANGRFQLTVRSANQGDFVSLEAVGAAAGSPARLRSLVGDFGALVAAADTSGRLDAAVQPRLNATQHSTAFTALAISANGGSLPTTGAQLDSAFALISNADALDMSALIQRVVDGGVALPAGKADVWSLVSDASAYRTFLDATVAADPLAFMAALQTARESRPYAAPPASDALAGRTIVYYGTGAGPDAAYVVTYAANGLVSVRSDYGTVGGQWTRDDQRITITFQQPLTAHTFSDDVDPLTGDLNEVQVTQTHLVIRKLALAPTAHGVTVVASQTYLDGSRAGQTVTLSSMDSPGNVLQSMDFANRLPVTMAEFSEGTRWSGFPKTFFSAPDGLPRIELLQDAIALGDAGAGTSLTDPKTSYRLSVTDDTVSIVSITNGTESLADQFVRLSVDHMGGERWLAMAPFVAGPLAGNAAVASIPVLPFTESLIGSEDVTRRWQALRSATVSFEHALFADGSGTTTSVNDGGAPNLSLNEWQFTARGIEIYYSPAVRTRVRTWLPLRRDSSGFWVLESFELLQPGSDEAPMLLRSRVLRLEDLGPATR